MLLETAVPDEVDLLVHGPPLHALQKCGRIAEDVVDRFRDLEVRAVVDVRVLENASGLEPVDEPGRESPVGPVKYDNQ